MAAAEFVELRAPYGLLALACADRVCYHGCYHGKVVGFEPRCDQVTYELVGWGGDDGLMTPEQVIGNLYPVPLYIQYR